MLIAFSCKKTPEIPTGSNKIEITDTEIDTVAYRTATIATTLTSTGGNELTQHGHCWSTDAEPTVENNKTELGSISKPKTFTSELTNLASNTLYYVRSYITYKNGVVYGTQQELQTLKTGIPTVSTNEVSSITLTSAQCGGNALADSGLIVLSKGVCWDTTSNVNIENNAGFTINGDSLGIFESSITELQEGMHYYVKAYSTNENGTSYGEVKQFIAQDPICGVLTVDYEGQTYNTVQIGEQCWFNKNLNYQIGNSWCYDLNSENCLTYGRLYDWETIMNGELGSNNVPSGIQGICPTGWHIPSDNEWKILEGNVDTQYGVGDPIWDEIGYRGLNVGNRLKTWYGWSSNSGSDDFGFSALPSGFYGTNGYFTSKYYGANWWTTSEDDSTGVWTRYLSIYENSSNRYNFEKEYGFSVRCLKD